LLALLTIPDTVLEQGLDILRGSVLAVLGTRVATAVAL
jgi:hypothetical protein